MTTNLFNRLIPAIIILLSWIFFGCSSRSASDGMDSSETFLDSTDEEEENKLTISFGIIDDIGEDNDIIKYAVKEVNDTISIYPDSGNYKNYRDSDEYEFHPERDDYCSDYIQNPKLQLYITNNSDETISFDKLRVQVESSVLDTFPYLYIEQTQTIRYGMEILNECWTNWGVMTIEYSFLKKGETFNGQYRHSLKIPYFENAAIIDFKNDLISDGFNPQKIEKYLAPSDLSDYEYSEILRYRSPVFGHNSKTSDVDAAYLIPDLSTAQISDLAFPFEYGENYEQFYLFARMHARISFSKSKFTKKIKGIIPLTCIYPGGAENDIVDDFNIELKPTGDNYIIDLPYITTLRPGQSERIQLGIKCVKSSHHKFKCILSSHEEEVLKSKPIKFYNINGRHSSYYVLKDVQED